MQRHFVQCGGLLVLWLGLGLAVPSLAASQRRSVIERIEPTAGPPGSTLQIVGRFFPDGAVVVVGGADAKVLKKRPGRWLVEVPRDAVTGRVSLRSKQGSVRGPEFRVVAAASPPTISSIAPPSGPPGTELVVSGEGFSTLMASNILKVGERVLILRSANPTELRAVIPVGLAPGKVSVVVDGGPAAVGPAFTPLARTRISGVEPQVGPAGTRVTIIGTGFSENIKSNRAFINGRRMQVIRSDDAEIVVVVPKGARSGTIMVDVRGAGRSESPVDFTVKQPATVAGFAPPQGLPGSEVVVSGQHFGNDVRDVKARMGQTELPVVAVKPAAVTVRVPKGAQSGAIEIQVAKGAWAKTRRRFTVREQVTLTSFSPTSGPEGTELVLVGEGFGKRRGDVRAFLADKALQVLSVTPTVVRAQVPASAVSGPIRIEVDGVSSPPVGQPFMVTHPPFVAGFKPTSAEWGQPVEIRGVHFGANVDAVDVTVAGTPMEVLAIDDGVIRARVPRGAESGRVVVRVRMQGVSSSQRSLKVTPAPEGLEISRVSSNCERVGCELVLHGHGFSFVREHNRVSFGSVPVKVKRSDSRSLVVQLPDAPGAASFIVKVRDVGQAESPKFTIKPR